MDNLWDDERTVREAGHDVPAWIDQDITMRDVAAIVQGGCASGAYIPAVTYFQARETMGEHGGAVLDYIDERLGEVPSPGEAGQSWSLLCCFYLSAAVDLWASGIESDAERKG